MTFDGSVWRRIGRLVAVAVFAVCTAGAAETPAQSARRVLDTAGVKGGLIAHVG